MMARSKIFFTLLGVLSLATACATAYKATPLPFRAPSSYSNAVMVDGVVIGGQAFADPKKAEETFGFDIRGAGMLPVQVAFDNENDRVFRIIPEQTFLEDEAGNLWPILSDTLAYERATKYAQTKQIFKEGAYSGLLGATAGAVIGAAIGIVAGEGVGSAMGKGAVLGGAAGATIGGVQGYSSSEEARHTVVSDLKQKSLQNRPIAKGLSFGVIFFPGEAKSVKKLRLQIRDESTGADRVVNLEL